MKVVFKRVIMNEVLTTYLPTALLIIISYSTTFFSDDYFEANLTVNLSVMFVMTTLFVSVMEKLPRTSYIRMVDIWLIYGQLFPFLEVVLVTFKEYCATKRAREIFTLEMEHDIRCRAPDTKKVSVKKTGFLLINYINILGWLDKRN